MRPLLLTFLLAALLPAQSPNASGGPLLPEQAAFDVLHYDLTLGVDPTQRTIDGTLTVVAKVLAPLKELVLHLDAPLEVKKVTAGEKTLPHHREAGLLRIPLPTPAAAGDELRATVHYGGKPRVAKNPPWNGGFTWSKTKSGQPWIATTCQGEGADLWWPCKDHPSDKPDSVDLRITVPAGLVCASNGVLKSNTKNRDRTRTFHWQVRQPIANYNVALNIAPYEVLESSFKSVGGEKVPVFFWVLPESVKKAKKALPEFIDHLRFFEDVLGPYPFRSEKYGIAETPHLGMEHQTIIAYGNRFRKLSFDYDWLHHHEASHEWWGNLVTCRDWKDMWIHEGFGTYMQALYVERTHGPKALRIDMAGKRRSLRNRRPVAPLAPTDSKGIYFGATGGFDNDIYYKGAWILHTLRYLIGDDTFFPLLRRFAYPDPATESLTDGTQTRFVDTQDFITLTNHLTHQDLGWFFDLYLRQPTLPELAQKRTNDALHLSWKTPDDLPFPLPVPLLIDDKPHRLPMPGNAARLELSPGATVEIDPDHWLLRQEPPRRRR